MNALMEQINSAGLGFVEFAWPMLWQSGLLITILFAADFLLRNRIRAVFRYWLWMLVIIKLILPTSISSPVSIGRLLPEQAVQNNITAINEPVGSDIPDAQDQLPKTTAASESLPVFAASAPVLNQPVTYNVAPSHPAALTWQGAVMLVWSAVVIVMLLLFLQRVLFVFGLVRRAKESNDLMKDMLGFCCKVMGVSRQVGLKVSAGAASPAVCGLFRPVILLPHGLGSNLGSSQLKVVLMHELAHIRRGDLWISSVQALLQIAYFYNPLLWIANWIIRRVREQAVDEAVQVALGERAQQYPQTLLNVARLAFDRPALSLRLIGVVESKSALTERIKRMLNRPLPKTAKIGIIGSLVIILLAAILLPMAKAKDIPGAAGANKIQNNLQGLIDSAQAQGTVEIPDGTYTEPIKIRKSLTLKGRSRDGCIFDVTANEPAIMIDTAGKGKVTLENLTIKWQLSTSDKCEQPYAVGIKDTTAQVTNCRFEPMGNFKRCPTALQADGFSQLSVKGCRFEGFDYTVCFGEGTKGVVEDCLVMDSGHQGVSVYAGAEVKAAGNVIGGSQYHGIRCTGSKMDLRDNLIIDNKNRGVYLGNKSASGQIINNVIIRNATGISSFAQSDLQITNNVISESGFSGVDMRSSCELTIRDNIICENAQGIVEFKEGAAGANKLLVNTFWQNNADVNNIEKPAGCISAEPLFSNIKNGDFSLKDGPVKSAGHGLTNPDVFRNLWQLWQNRNTSKAVAVIAAAEFAETPQPDMNKAQAADIELAHDDGKQVDKLSSGGSGHAVKFKRPNDAKFLNAVKIYGSRYGEVEPPAEDFHVWLCDPNFEVIKEFAFPYSLFKMRGLAKWAMLDIDQPTELPDEFIICVGFDPRQTKGIYMYYDANASGYSFMGLPGSQLEPFDKGDWMIRAIVGKTAESKPRANRPAPAPKGPPMVIRTTPEAFANNVSPLLNTITATFDQPMMDKSWSWTGGGDTYPKTPGQIRYDERKMTCSLPVELEPGKIYWVGINSPSYQGFVNVNGIPAKRYVILFATKGKDGSPTPIPEDLLKDAKAINGQSRAEKQ